MTFAIICAIGYTIVYAIGYVIGYDIRIIIDYERVNQSQRQSFCFF